MEESFDLLDDSFEIDDSLNVELSEIDLQSSYREEFFENVKFPILVIDGITTEEEIRHFRSMKPTDGSIISMYCLVNGIPMKVCDISLTLDSLLLIRNIYSYKLKLLRTIDDVVDIDLNDSATLCKFIKL